MPDSISPQIAKPLTNGDKCRIAARLFDAGKDREGYSALRWILDTSEWPAWLQETARTIDFLTGETQ